MPAGPWQQQECLACNERAHVPLEEAVAALLAAVAVGCEGMDYLAVATPASLGRLATAVLLRGQDTSTETGTVRIRRSKMIQLVETKGPQAQLCFPGTALLSREEARSSTSHSVAKDKGDTQRPDYPRK
jgi:hypothetical protein